MNQQFIDKFRNCNKNVGLVKQSDKPPLKI